uniref:Acyl_transf_3 domain-containing protein n=1 Tax=Panagrellus redivivus TaxID=6233 RepID=A0A7E4VXS7_PANRE
MQFYAVAPFILAVIARSTRPILASSVLIGLSLAFQSFVPSPIWSFDCVISRIWQFLVGTIVFYMERSDDSNITKSRTSTTTFVSVVVLTVLLLAPKLSQDVIYEIAVRVMATLLTASIMYSSTSMDEVTSLKPVTRVLTLLGDASYSIYLVHWPMIRFAKYVEIFDSTG